jgi:hypothetical protein
MKNRIVIDLQVFNSILRELKGIRKELRQIKGEPEKKALPKRTLEDAISTSEVLRMLKITPATLNQYEKKGFLKYHKEGRSKIFSQTEVLAFKKVKGRSKRLSKKVLNRLSSF